ncbi:MAG: Maf family protein [Agriterribacter sp.]
MEKIVLASQSPRRKLLLEWAEIPFDVIIQSTDESFPENITPAEAAIYVAQQKAIAVQSGEVFKKYERPLPVLAADTMVVCERKIIGKPRDKEDAINMLKLLSGKKHLVITGVVIKTGTEEIAFADTTEVWFHELTDEQINFYVEQYKPYDKAGAYGIQEWIGVVGIERISGDFYNVMGLPISRVVKALNNDRV